MNRDAAWLGSYWIFVLLAQLRKGELSVSDSDSDIFDELSKE